MRLHLLSDLHLDHDKDRGVGFVSRLQSDPEAVVVLAGDITTARWADDLRWLFTELSRRYAGVVYVPGNHEYYGTSPAYAHRAMEVAGADLDNVHVLLNEAVDVAGTSFYGGTMWYREPPPQAPEHWMHDGRAITNFKPWVYEQQAAFEAGLPPAVDVVVSHHLPSPRSVPAVFKNSPLNPFFVCDMEQVVLVKKPRFWLHGHTHSRKSYAIGNTAVAVNARGYPRELVGPYRPRVIDVDADGVI